MKRTVSETLVSYANELHIPKNIETIQFIVAFAAAGRLRNVLSVPKITRCDHLICEKNKEHRTRLSWYLTIMN